MRKTITWGQGTLGGKRLLSTTTGANGRDSKMIKWGPGDVGIENHIMTSKGATTATATQYIEGGECKKQINLSTPFTLLDSKPSRVPNKILEGHVPSAKNPSNRPCMRREIGTVTTTKEKGDGRVLPRELLDNGQGKFTMLADGDSDMDISVESTTEADKQPKEQ